MIDNEWRDHAECTRVGASLDLFFPEDPDIPSKEREAKKICAECPVINECRQFALDNFKYVYDSGVWGGTTRAERRVLRKLQTRNR